MKSIRATLLLAAALAVSPAFAERPDDHGFDPTGVWYRHQGPLVLVRAGDTLSFDCTVVTPKARSLTVATSPEPRKGYVVKGDVVEAVGLVNESTPAWLLVRYVGKKQTTAGLLERDALECQEEEPLGPSRPAPATPCPKGGSR